MKPNKLTLVAILATLLVAVTTLSAADYVPGQLIVKFKHGIIDVPGVNQVSTNQVSINDANLAGVLERFGTLSFEKVFKSQSAQEGRTYNDVRDVYRIRMNPSLDMEQVAKQLEQLSGVKYACAELNGSVVYHSVPRNPPNDYNFSYIPYTPDPNELDWCLHQWGFGNDYPGEPGWDINALEAWGITVGNPNILLCIIDSGLEDEHCITDREPIIAEFDGRLAPDGRYPPGWTDDDVGHGTWCAGLAGAWTNSYKADVGIRDTNFGIAGVAGGWYPNEEGAKLLIGYDGNDQVQMADAFDWARDRGASVISCSWSLPPVWGEPAFMTEAIENAFAEDIAVFFAAGNCPRAPTYDVQYPARLAKRDICSAVGAMDKWGIRGTYSCHGPELSFIAPGNGTNSLWRGNPDGSGNFFWHAAGTSAATPISAGIAALLYSYAYENGLHLWDVDCKRIMEISTRFNYDHYTPDTQTSIGPWNEEIGYGCVDAYAALRLLDSDHSLVHGTITDPVISVVETPSATVFFDSAPLEYLLRGKYLAKVYKASGSVSISPLRMFSGAWGRLYDGAPGYELDLTSNDAILSVSRERNTDPNCAAFCTYIYELRGYDYDWDGDFLDPGEQWSYSRWAPRDTSTVQIAYTYISTGIPTSPKDYIVESHTLEPVLSVIGSNLGSSVTISYQLPAAIEARIAVFDVTGREVTTLVSGKQPAGLHELTWGGVDNAGRQVSKGVYFIRMETPSCQVNEKVTLLR